MRLQLHEPFQVVLDFVQGEELEVVLALGEVVFSILELGLVFGHSLPFEGELDEHLGDVEVDEGVPGDKEVPVLLRVEVMEAVDDVPDIEGYIFLYLLIVLDKIAGLLFVVLHEPEPHVQPCPSPNWLTTFWGLRLLLAESHQFKGLVSDWLILLIFHIDVIGALGKDLQSKLVELE